MKPFQVAPAGISPIWHPFNFSIVIFEERIHMKGLLLWLFVVGLPFAAGAQNPVPASKGVEYGAGTTQDGSVSVNELPSLMLNGNFTGKITGKVKAVCPEKGCWMKLEKENGELLFVKFKDYGFFVPKDIVGHTVVLNGQAVVKEVSIKQRKNKAAEMGKSKAEIESINTPGKETQFIAKGVLVL